ncbi:Mitochondrial import receptor subunit TOM34 [Liparis tanakae]|uniref:Mitochondrial import receptor subunit TOM34 n=1 Tax=Liparis tanakae TaxID=230148 RepID=A0A4Z2FP86_9TELE|nr:Mitochondrial import receptor subunit TOM34 [Liparis tanakae]
MSRPQCGRQRAHSARPKSYTFQRTRTQREKKGEVKRIQCGTEVPERSARPARAAQTDPARAQEHREKRNDNEAAMPQKQRTKSWTELKQAGNECFKTGQYGEATGMYSQAIKELEKSNKKSPEDLGILHSNRAASYLKEGNCAECVKDCNLSLELFPFNVKSLLRRAAAYEALERYRLAYVDYKTALLIDCNIAAAHEGTNRYAGPEDEGMTKALTEADGLSWREKLPPIPTISLSDREKLAQKSPAAAAAPPTAKHNGNRQTNRPREDERDIKGCEENLNTLLQVEPKNPSAAEFLKRRPTPPLPKIYTTRLPSFLGGSVAPHHLAAGASVRQHKLTYDSI